MQNDLEELFLNTLLYDQVLIAIFQDCLFHERYEWTQRKDHGYRIKEKEIKDLKFFANENLNHKQSFDERKKDDDASYFDSKMVRKILNIHLKSKVSYPRQVLFVQAMDLFEKQRIGLGIAIVMDQRLEDDLQNDLLYMQVALQMQKQFHQNQTESIDQFYTLIFVGNLPLEHSKRNQACVLGWIDDPFKDQDEHLDKTAIRMVISYFNERNRNWDYMRLLELLWNKSEATDQKVKVLQEEFGIVVSKAYIDILDELKMRK